MPRTYQVRAQVVDLNTDVPKSTDRLLIDTNVWFWMCYSNASHGSRPPHFYQTNDYPNYLKKVGESGATLHWCGLSLSELGNLIEKTELDIAQMCGAVAPTLSVKEYRHGCPIERARIGQEISDAWAQVGEVSNPLPIPPVIDEQATSAALSVLKTSALDAYDSLLIHAQSQNRLTGIVSDDGDFCTVPGITLFTANRSVLSAARSQQKLLVR